MTSDERGEVVWQPSPEAWTSTRIGQFARSAAEASGREFRTYRELHNWSVEDLEGFWDAFQQWVGVRWAAPPERVLDDGDRSMPGTRWFPGGTLNYAEHALGHVAENPDGIAVISRSQTRDRQELTWAQLAAVVARCRTGLLRLGVGKGDVVAAYAPNLPETLIAFLATTSLGGIWTSCAPEFGVQSVIDRWCQIQPKVLVAVDGYRYGVKHVDRAKEIGAIVDGLPSLKEVIRMPYLHTIDDGWSALLDSDPGPLSYEPVSSDHPLYVLFSSGTTGLPKPIIHGHGGITVEHLKVLALHHDLGPGRRFSWFTTTGWMMWNYLVSGLLVGATLVLFDGDPGYPDLGSLWRIASEESVAVFGVSAPFLMSCRETGLHPRDGLDLSGLQQVGSTGAPLPADGFRWVSEAVGRHVQLASVSGGTDVCTAFVGANPLSPVRAGEISGAMLGCDVRAVRTDGSPSAVGEQGELVLAAPLPSMPVGFWGDATGERYRKTYFAAHPGMWSHGDWVTFQGDGACIISGRSDATLNRGGIRMGTSEFYRVVESVPGVVDSLVVHLDDHDELLLFIVLAPGAELGDGLRASIDSAIRAELSPRHVPDRMYAVPAVPRTLSGKKLEVPVKRVLQGVPVGTAAAPGALADPNALGWFAEYAAAR